MVTVCQKCGVPGYTELLMYCNMCRTSAEHRYCLDKLPSHHEELSWLCDQCKPRPPKVELKRHKSMRNLKCQLKKAKHIDKMLNIKKRHGNIITASKVASPQKSHHHITCRPDVHEENLACSTLNRELSINRSPASLLHKEVDDLSQPSGIQFEGKHSKKQRRRLILPEDDQLDHVQTDDAVNERLLEGRYENIVTASKVASPQKLRCHITCSPDVHKENPAGSTVNGESGINRSPASSSQKEVDQLPQSFRMQFEGKNSKLQRRRLILLEDGQLDEDVHTKNMINERHSKVKKPMNVSKLFDYNNLKKSRRRLILPDEDLLDEEAHLDGVGQESHIISTLQLQATLQIGRHSPRRKKTCNWASSYQPFNLTAQPIIHHIWWGYLDVCNGELGPLTAHVSSRACEKVWNIAKKLPRVMRMRKLSRLHTWPKSFKTTPPNDESIALYFFAQVARVEAAHDELLDDVTRNDLSLMVVLDEAELLMFSSIVLPESYHKFQGKYYLWGVFRRRQDPVSCVPADNCLNSDEITEEKQWMQDFTHGAEKEFDDNDGEACDQGHFGFALKDEGTANHHLNLFPVECEDMALTSRVGGSISLDLELGFSRSACDSDAHLKYLSRTDSPSELFLGGAIFL